MKKAALISVSNRSGLESFAKELVSLEYEILSTKGTADFLESHQIPCVRIEEYTGQKEILDGRVKTLHPKIHAGLLAKKDSPAHLKQLEEDGIYNIEVAVINLYPFKEGLATESANSSEKMVELIDIGGPTMIRAAAKNYRHVWPVIDVGDYPVVAEMLRNSTSQDAYNFRKQLAAKVFTQLADYNLQIARYLSSDLPSETQGLVLLKQQSLRYGENPHQNAGYFSELDSERIWEQLSGKPLSYNNMLDLDAGIRILKVLPEQQPAAAIVKHLNPCGAAINDTLVEALERAKAGDPRSHFGGIIICTTEVDELAARNIISDFCELVIAESYSDAALKVLCTKKNLRVLKIEKNRYPTTEWRSAAGGVLIQSMDQEISYLESAKIVSEQKPTLDQLTDLQFAWNMCSQVKSNAILLVKNRMILGTGAGQMSRIDSVELAIKKAKEHGHNLEGAVAASDAFFPFSDSVTTLADSGVSAVVATCGAKRDEEIVMAANAAGISLLFVEDRHFRH